MGIIVFIGLIALIAWGLNYLMTKDFVTVRTPTPPVSTNTRAISVTQDDIFTVATSSIQNTISTNATTSKDTTAAASTTPTTPKTPASTPTQTSSALVVTYTDKGFSPSSLTIKKGQTVKFINDSSNKMWVAANPFPSSSEYPAFNAKSGVASGSSWSFTFDKTGVWFYHNHFSPAQGGKIVVNAK